MPSPARRTEYSADGLHPFGGKGRMDRVPDQHDHRSCVFRPFLYPGILEYPYQCLSHPTLLAHGTGKPLPGPETNFRIDPEIDRSRDYREKSDTVTYPF